jgi:MFS transporter, DHA1 family, multidrug resistance protein
MMRSWKATNALFLTTMMLQGLAYGHINAYLPLYLKELGLSDAEVSTWPGILFAVMMGVAFPFAPFWGALAERYSKRMVVIRAHYFEIAAHLVLFFAQDIWWVVGSRILLGMTYGNGAVVIATQAQLTPRKHVGTAIAIVQAAMPIAASIGPPAGAVIIDHIGLRGLFLVDACLAITSSLLLTFLMPEPPKAQPKGSVLSRTGESLGMIWNRPVLRWNFLCLFLTVGARGVVDVYLPVRITEVAADPAPAIGAILGAAGVVTAIATIASGKLLDAQGGIRWLMPLMLLGAATIFGTAFAPQVWLIGLLACVRAIPLAAANTITVAHLTRVLPQADQTVILSLTPLPRNMATFLFPVLAAAIAPLGVGLALVIGSLAYAASAVAGLLAQRETPKEIARIRKIAENAVGDVDGRPSPGAARA